MKRFIQGQRITVNGKDAEYPKLQGKSGTVSRKRIADNGAWVTMDEVLPKELQSFPDPKDARHKNIILYPDQCEPAQSAPAGTPTAAQGGKA